MRTILVTGGAGFIGSSFVRWVLSNQEDVRVIVYDLLTYAGNLRNLDDVSRDVRYQFVRGDIASAGQVGALFASAPIDVVVNFAAETHVDRSIVDSAPFIRTNVAGTQCLLEGARQARVSKFVQISTDEVYGSLSAEGRFQEETPLDPTNPYAASKAAADLLALSYFKTYRLPVLVTRCSNNFGPYQFPEKFIPLMITNALDDKPLPVYGDGMNVREWIYVDEHSRAVWIAVEKGSAGEVYNIGGGHEAPNLNVVRQILAQLGKPESLLTFVKDRPAHDRRYAIDCSKIAREWGWSVQTRFNEALADTVAWYRSHLDWVREIKDASYLSYYERMYTSRDETLARLENGGPPPA